LTSGEREAAGASPPPPGCRPASATLGDGRKVAIGKPFSPSRRSPARSPGFSDTVSHPFPVKETATTRWSFSERVRVTWPCCSSRSRIRRPWTGGGTSVGRRSDTRRGADFREDLHRPHLGSGQAPDLFRAFEYPVDHPEHAAQVVKDVRDLPIPRGGRHLRHAKNLSLRGFCLIDSNTNDLYDNKIVEVINQLRERFSRELSRLPSQFRLMLLSIGVGSSRVSGRSCSTGSSGGRSTPFPSVHRVRGAAGGIVRRVALYARPGPIPLVFVIPALGGLVSG